MSHLRLLTRILSGLRATGILCMDITAGTRVIGLVPRIPARAGLVHASKAVSITTAIGRAIAAALSTATNGIAIGTAIMAVIASTMGMATSITTTVTKSLADRRIRNGAAARGKNAFRSRFFMFYSLSHYPLAGVDAIPFPRLQSLVLTIVGFVMRRFPFFPVLCCFFLLPRLLSAQQSHPSLSEAP